VLFALGRERLRENEIAEAEALLREAWQRDPTLLSAPCTLARCLGLHAGRGDEALEILEGLSARPLGRQDSALVEVVRAEIYLELGRVALAREAADEALEYANPESYAERAACAALARVENLEGVELAEKTPEAALFSFKRAADLDPDWSAPLVNMGAAFVKLGRLTRARTCYEMALGIDPDNPTAHANLGRWFAKTGKREQALHCFQAALRLDPRDAGTLAALAHVRTRPK